jgi:hypothetical protein
MSVRNPGACQAVKVRFSVIGWNSEECDRNERTLVDLKRYVEAAVSGGLEAVLIQQDLLDAGSLFEAVDVDVVRTGTCAIATVIAIASGRSDLVELEPARTPAAPVRLVA